MVPANRVRLSVIGIAGFAFLLGLSLVCCTRSSTPGVSTRQPPAADSSKPTETAEPRPPSPQQAEPNTIRFEAPGDDPAEAVAPIIDMEGPESPEPKTPHYVSIVEEIKPAQPSKVHARIVSPTKLVLTTENVKRIRVTRQGLPLARNRSIVLRIDDQGIEWTRQYLAVELERSRAGEWTVVRRRPAKP